MNHTRFNVFSFLLLIISFAASCSPQKNTNSTNIPVNQTNGTASQPIQSGKLTTFKLTSAGKEPFSATAELKFGKWNAEQMKDDNFEFVRQTYCLSNSPKFNEPFVVMEGEEFLRVCFSINESRRWQDRGPVKPGAYYVGADERSDMGKIVLLSVQSMKNDRPIQANIDVTNNYGNLTIESVTEGSIDGKVSLSDKNFSLNGSFAAELQ